MSTKQVILHRGQLFSAKDSGLFAKDVVHVGKWFHPTTGKEVVFDAARIERLRASTTAYLAAGNKIPFRDGHKNSVLANMGEWTGPFAVHGDALYGVVAPKLPGARQGIEMGAIDGVSVVIEFDQTDSKKNHYDEVITAIDATDFPVLTEQKEFVALSKDSEGNEVYFHESLKLSSDGAGDCFGQHDALSADLQKKTAAFSSAKSTLGEHHPDTKAAAGKMTDAAIRLRKQAQVVHDHVANMSGGPVYYDRTEPSAYNKLVDQITAKGGAELLGIDPDAFSLELAKASGKVNADGTFKGGFDGCVLHMKNQGYSQASAEAICGKINANKNG